MSECVSCKQCGQSFTDPLNMVVIATLGVCGECSLDTKRQKA